MRARQTQRHSSRATWGGWLLKTTGTGPMLRGCLTEEAEILPRGARGGRVQGWTQHWSACPRQGQGKALLQLLPSPSLLLPDTLQSGLGQFRSPANQAACPWFLALHKACCLPRPCLHVELGLGLESRPGRVKGEHTSLMPALPSSASQPELMTGSRRAGSEIQAP